MEKKTIWLWFMVCSLVFFVLVAMISIFVLKPSQAETEKLFDIREQDQEQVLPLGLDDGVTSSVKQVEAVQIEGQPTQRVRIKAVGDMMLDRTVYLHTQRANNFNFPFERIKDFLVDADITVGNLEGAITDFKSISNGTGGQRFYFTFSPKFVDPLTTYFDVVSYANNHANNFGKEGLAQSRNYMDESGLTYFGDPNNDVGHLSTVIEKNGIRFGFVGFHELVGFGFSDVIEEVKNLDTTTDIVIVYPHWGYEYVTANPSKAQKQEGHSLIDAGADIVIGTHPHVIQPIEIYKDKLIFYSLGNFIFDQYFSEETQQGLALDILAEKRDNTIALGYTLIPIRISDVSQPFVAEKEEADAILSIIAQNSVVTSTVKEQIKIGQVKL
ncbi:MAG: CapA family protein [Candidatus Magasanikbacteria bacterium]